MWLWSFKDFYSQFPKSPLGMPGTICMISFLCSKYKEKWLAHNLWVSLLTQVRVIMYSVSKKGYLTLLWPYSSLPDDPQVQWNTKLVGTIIADHIKINRIEVVNISFADVTCYICWHLPQFWLIIAGEHYASLHSILYNITIHVLSSSSDANIYFQI